MASTARLRKTEDPLTQRVRDLMEHGPMGRMRQIEMVRRAASLGMPGFNRAEINRLVQGTIGDPRLSTLRKVAAVFGVGLADLLEDDSRVPLATWQDGAFVVTGKTAYLPPEFLPPGDTLVAVERTPDLIVIDTGNTVSRSQSLMAVKDPETGALEFMRAFIEDLGMVRFTGPNGRWLMGGDDLCVGEVVVVLSRVTPRPSVIREAVTATVPA